MVRSARRRYSLKSKKTIKIKSLKKKQELNHLFNELNELLPSCSDKNHVKSSNVVLRAVKYIYQLHRKVAEENGVEALHQIQENARIQARRQLMTMKNKANEVRISYFSSCGRLFLF